MRAALRAVPFVAVLLFAAVPSWGAIYLKIGDIKGSAAEAQHRDWIEATTYQMSGTSVGFSLGGLTGGRAAQEFTVEKPLDRATAGLRDASRRHELFTQVLVDVVSPKSTSHMVLKHVQIGSVVTKQGGRAEIVTLEYATFEMSVTKPAPQPADGH